MYSFTRMCAQARVGEGARARTHTHTQTYVTNYISRYTIHGNSHTFCRHANVCALIAYMTAYVIRINTQHKLKRIYTNIQTPVCKTSHKSVIIRLIAIYFMEETWNSYWRWEWRIAVDRVLNERLCGKRIEESIFTAEGHFSSLPCPDTFRGLNTLLCDGNQELLRLWYSHIQGTCMEKAIIWRETCPCSWI